MICESIGVIILMTQVLGLGLRKMRQPRVIAEVLGGILLGTYSTFRAPLQTGDS
jgi:Kef-type K+ transport system membrane component KefB